MARIRTVINIFFQEVAHGKELFEAEFEKFSETDSDPISQWVKKAKAKGELDSDDYTVVYLLTELQRKVDELTKIIKNETQDRIHLQYRSTIESCWYEEIELAGEEFEEGKIYYARLDLPIFPKREVPMFIKASNSTTAVIVRMHERDRKDWDSYLVTKEREQILDMKGLA